MAKYFFNIIDFIRERQFEVLVPAFYHPNLPKHLTDPKPFVKQRPKVGQWTDMNDAGPPPFWSPPEAHQLQRASYSIEVMLDMFHRKIEFTIAKDDDIPEIFEGLDAYLRSLQGDIDSNLAHVIEFVKLALRWRERLYLLYYRYMQSNPAALEKLYHGGSPDKDLFHLLSKLPGTENQAYLDPLRAMSRPPVKFNDEPEKKAGTNVNDMTFGHDLPAAPGVTVDDGRDFDFSNFTSRK